jgi:hypothetical protein
METLCFTLSHHKNRRWETCFICVPRNKYLCFVSYSRWENNGFLSVCDTQHDRASLNNPLGFSLYCCIITIMILLNLHFGCMIWVILETVFNLQLYLASSVYTGPGTIMHCTRP